MVCEMTAYKHLNVLTAKFMLNLHYTFYVLYCLCTVSQDSCCKIMQMKHASYYSIYSPQFIALVIHEIRTVSGERE
jgi:hypothetical protein